jgi:hypothetical protein
MIGKNFFKKFPLANELFYSKKSLLLFFLLLFVVLLTPKATSAFLQGLIAPVISAVTTTVLTIIWGATSLLTVAVGGLFDIVLNLNISYTNEQFIYVGWKIIKDITNLFFVIALVVIGLCTAIGYQDYHAKKTLPILIAVAILINFSLVIAGFILDAANIVMNYFLSETVGIGNVFSNELQMIFPPGWGQTIISSFQPETPIKLAIAIAVNLIVSLTLFLYSILFLVRYAIIWFLVIVSPFAFFCYIFPATKQLFTKWWDTFFQWAIIGISAAFCLYLSMQLMSAFAGAGVSVNLSTISLSTDNILSFWFPDIGRIIPMVIVAVFSLIGLFITISSQFQTAMGQGLLTNYIQKGAKIAGVKVAGWVARSKATNAVLAKAQQLSTKAQTFFTPTPYQPGAGAAAWLGHYAKRALGAGIPGTPWMSIPGFFATTEAALRQLQSKDRDVTKKASEELQNIWKGDLDLMLSDIQKMKTEPGAWGTGWFRNLTSVFDAASKTKGGLQKLKDEEPDFYYKAINYIIETPAHHALVEDIVKHDRSMLTNDKTKDAIGNVLVKDGAIKPAVEKHIIEKKLDANDANTWKTTLNTLSKDGKINSDVAKYVGENIDMSKDDLNPQKDKIWKEAINYVAQQKVNKKLTKDDIPFLEKDKEFLTNERVLEILGKTKGSLDTLKQLEKRVPDIIARTMDAVIETTKENGKINTDLLKKCISENSSLFAATLSPNARAIGFRDMTDYDQSLTKDVMRQLLKEATQKPKKP